jgi:hypothetical protein
MISVDWDVETHRQLGRVLRVFLERGTLSIELNVSTRQPHAEDVLVRSWA